jgi:histidinol-phosphate phosphatase family protein
MPSPSPSSHGHGNRLQKAVFLDRDGVINHDSPAYIKSVAEFDFIPGSRQAIAALTQAGFVCVVITNQSAIGRGMITPAILTAIHAYMSEQVAARGGQITDILFCPHRPDEDCVCRKPRPDMIRRAAQIHGIDLARAYMVGDSAKDIACARRAGCRAILVKTGDFKAAKAQLTRQDIEADFEAADLLTASRWILAHS